MHSGITSRVSFESIAMRIMVAWKGVEIRFHQGCLLDKTCRAALSDILMMEIIACLSKPESFSCLALTWVRYKWRVTSVFKRTKIGGSSGKAQIDESAFHLFTGSGSVSMRTNNLVSFISGVIDLAF